MKPSGDGSGAVGLIVDTDWLGEEWHCQDIEVGLTPASHINIHVLTWEMSPS